jgi:hypothetical protein
MINLKIKNQPDDETCGPTSLHSVYRYYGDKISLKTVLNTVKRVTGGGTIASHLGCHALERGYQAKLFTYNLKIFDPSWFPDGKSSREYLYEKLMEQKKHKSSKKTNEVSDGYANFLQLGGDIFFKDLSTALLRKFFTKSQPIITGLSATYLYNSIRETFTEEGVSVPDDILGEPCGHFVVLCGYDEDQRHMIVADPHQKNPLSKDNYYTVDRNRLINSIMLGVLTYDATLLIISPRE